MQFYTRVLLMAMAVVCAFSSCQDEISPLIVGTSYDGTTFEANSAPAQNAISSYKNLIKDLDKGNSGAILSTSSLNLNQNDGTFYLPSRIIGGFQPVLNKYIEAAILNSGKTFVPGQTQNGGILTGHLFNENGIAISSMIEKGLYGALFYYQSAKMLKTGMSQADLDMVLAYYGSNPSFPNTTNRTQQPDILAAANVCKRDKNDGKGMYSDIKLQFLTIQATIAGGTDYSAEQAEAISKLKVLWEKSNAATIISHCMELKNILSIGNLNSSAQAQALHNYSEVIGLLYGWKFLVNSDKVITDRDLKEIFGFLNMTETSSDGYKFVTESETQLPKIDKVVNKLAFIYGFTATDIEEFQTNWALVQGR